MHRPVRLLASAAVASTLLVGTAARAEGPPTTSECVSLNENAGPLQKAGKLLEAHASLVRCSASTCPALVRDDCAKGAIQVDAAIPTIVFEARDGGGNDRSEVRLSVDGTRRADKLTGVALDVDPGEHEFRFETAGLPPLVKHYVIHAGEKNRREQIVLGAAAAGAPQPASPEPAGKGSAVRPVGLVIAGIGGAGLVVGGVFGLLARSKWNQAVADCGSGCAEGTTARSLGSTAHVDASVSNVAFAAGGGLAVVGLVLFLVAPHSSETKGADASPRALLTPFGGPGSVGLSATGTFR
jgi:hypothetical protein